MTKLSSSEAEEASLCSDSLLTLLYSVSSIKLSSYSPSSLSEAGLYWPEEEGLALGEKEGSLSISNATLVLLSSIASSSMKLSSYSSLSSKLWALSNSVLLLSLRSSAAAFDLLNSLSLSLSLSSMVLACPFLVTTTSSSRDDPLSFLLLSLSSDQLLFLTGDSTSDGKSLTSRLRSLAMLRHTSGLRLATFNGSVLTSKLRFRLRFKLNSLSTLRSGEQLDLQEVSLSILSLSLFWEPSKLKLMSGDWMSKWDNWALKNSL